MSHRQKITLPVICSAAVAFIICCAPTVHEPKVVSPPSGVPRNPFLYDFNEVIRFGDLKPGQITEATDRALEKADSILDDMLAVPDKERTFNNTMRRIDDIYRWVEKIWSPSSLMGSTHPSRDIRQEADSSSIRFERYLNDLAVNEDLYAAVVAFGQTAEARVLSGVKKKFLEETMRDFRRSGFGLGKEEREQVNQIQNALSEIGLEFRRNISSYQDTLLITKAEATGLPEAFLKDRSHGDGQYAIDMSYPSYFPFMKFADSDEARRKLSHKFLNRARDKNLDVLDEILRLRRNLAEVLGYQSFAEYRTEDRMTKEPATVWEFERDLQISLREKARIDYQEMLAMKSQITDMRDSVINPWEKLYYENRLLQEKYQVNEEEIKQYFEIGNVIDGLFAITQRLFNLEYREVKNPSVWHKDVKMYEVYSKENGGMIARFYLDLYPRADKYQHAAAFSVVMGKGMPDGYQKPAYCLVCNFPKPSWDSPSLLPHDDVETFFHEFGHLLHGVLTKSEYIRYSGTSVPRDFVEAPSQMLENWVWDKESLALFARHHETGEVIPSELLERMLSARNLNSGTKALQQVFYSVYDFTLHDGYDPDGERSTTDVLRELQNGITLYPYQEDTHFQGSFGHLYGYAAGYYGYMWSEVYAQDMFSVFEENGVLDQNTGMRFRRLILEKGGTDDPLVMVREFLGREPNNQAFLRSLGLESEVFP